MRKITLTPEQLAHAREIGRKRQSKAIDEGRKDGQGLQATLEEDLDIHVRGALGEQAFAALFGGTVTVGYAGKPTDVRGVEVKHVWRPTDHLILPKTQKRYFHHNGRWRPLPAAVIVGSPPTFHYAGWAYATDVMLVEYCRQMQAGRPEVFAVPLHVLETSDPPMTSEEDETDDE